MTRGDFAGSLARAALVRKEKAAFLARQGRGGVSAVRAPGQLALDEEALYWEDLRRRQEARDREIAERGVRS